MPASQETIASQEPTGELGLPLPTNHARLPRFEYLIDFLESLARISGPGSKTRRWERINVFIAAWRKDVGNDIYPAFQLILPHVDTDIRQLYNLKETALARILVKALELNPKSGDALQLMDIRKSATGAVPRDEGLASKAEFAIAKRNTRLAFSTWTLDALISKLVELSQGTRQRREEILKEMIESMNSVEMKWVVRIILRHMQLNCSEKMFFQCWHSNAQILYNVTNNLKIVCNQLWDPTVRLEASDQSVRPLACFKPMRAKFIRGAVADMSLIVLKMRTPMFYLEEKIDGERIQLHWTEYGRKCRYLSRKGKDFTEQYGSNCADESQNGSLTPYLGHIFNPKVETCILDGEMAAWDTINNELCALGKVREASKATNASQLRPLYLVFDCLHLNGKDLSRQPLRARKGALERIILPENRDKARGYIEILPYVKAETSEEISKVFNRAISQMSEGIVVKNPESRYVLDGITDAWLKVKPEFVSGYEGENFDLIVVGGYRGSGKWANRCSSFLCALRDQTKEFHFVTLCRVGSGFCTVIFDLIEDIVKYKWFAQSTAPEWLTIGQEKSPDYYIDPRDSVVFEIKASQISSVFADRGTDTDAYGAGYSLRFPRFVRLREDRDYNNSLSVGEFLAYRTATTEQVIAQKNKKRSQNTGNGRLSALKRLKHESENLPKLELQSRVFEGLYFFVAGDIMCPEDKTKVEFEQYIQQHGGNTTDTIESGVLVIADRRVPSIMAILSSTEEPVLHPRWVFDSVLNGRQLPPEPSHFFYASAVTGSELVDKFGFSLYRKQSHRDIKACLSCMNTSSLHYENDDLNANLQALTMMHASENKPLKALLFAGLMIYLDLSTEDAQLVRWLLRYGSAQISDLYRPGLVTHIICDAQEQQGQYLRGTNSPHVVTSNWVFSCWRETTLLDEREYRFGT